jgi:hypothetical protein
MVLNKIELNLLQGRGYCLEGCREDNKILLAIHGRIRAEFL